MTWFWLNILLAAAFFAAVTGSSLWLVFKHPDTAPDFSQAHAYLAAKQPQPAPPRAGPREDRELAGAGT